ncbi:MAG: hypothetical protein QI199_03140 [Candidatus Korarchaeota archaeon]|nr:hypothetical protein [Candidatus Korarchaeota archaeon]
MISQLEGKLERAKELAHRDPGSALALLRKVAEEVLRVAAPDWDPSRESLAEYAEVRRYPDFFHEMADRIEGSYRFVMQAGEGDVLGAISSTAFLLEVLRRLPASSS